MSVFSPTKQQGVVLITALVMLLTLTLLAVNSMRSVTFETRMTAARVEAIHLEKLADAALREGEFRLYGPALLADKLEANLVRNCVKDNTLDSDGENRPCLLSKMSDAELLVFYSTPVSFFKQSSTYTSQYAHRSGVAIQAADANAVVAWMPYRGLDPAPSNYVTSVNDTHAYWNSYRMDTGSAENETLNPEYGAALQGKGTFFYLVTAQADDTVAAQSMVAVIYLGLEN